MASWKMVVPSMKKLKMESIVLQFHQDHHLHHLALIPPRKKTFQFHTLHHHPFLRDSFLRHQYQIVLHFLHRFLLELVYLHPFQLGAPTRPLPLLQLLLVGT
jgi:hypothetical protein